MDVVPLRFLVIETGVHFGSRMDTVTTHSIYCCRCRHRYHCLQLTAQVSYS